MKLPNYIVVEEGAQASPYARAFARKMVTRLAASRVENDKLYRKLTDGTEIIATRVHTQYRVTISTLTTSITSQTIESTVWLPRGFVLYPSSSTSTSGWGTPVVRAGAPDPLNADSLAPGLDVSRWTNGGQLGEVLLTKQAGNGYPKTRFEITPAFFSADESPTMESSDGVSFVASKKPYQAAALQADWSAYRIEFTDFSTAGGEGDAGARQQVFRWAVGGTQYLPPIRGYYDAAARLARYAVSADFTGLRLDDGDLSQAHAGYATAAQRLNKDGVADAAAHDSASKATNAIVAADDAATGAHLIDSTFTPARTSVSVALKNGMTALAATEHAQWIAYGNRYWIADDAAIPQVSWDGYPSWNWPLYLVQGLVGAGAFVDLSYATAPVRGQVQPLFSKRVCANGREIGTLPDFVISAGVQTTTDSSTNVTVDRLVVLAWNVGDQGVPAPVMPSYNDSYNRVLRVYFVDMPRRNGLALAPSQAVIGLYDATTNPGGWHYAGTVTLFPEPDSVEYVDLFQPPQFKGDGTKAVFIYTTISRGGGLLVGRYAQEITFSAIADGSVAYSIGAPAGVVTGSTATGFGPLAIDYRPASAQFATIYAVDVNNVPGCAEGDCSREPTIDTVIRWSLGANNGASDWREGDVLASRYLHTLSGFGSYSLYVLDPLLGAFVAVGQRDTLVSPPSTYEVGSFNVVYSVGGMASVGKTYAAPSGIPMVGPTVDLYANYAGIAITAFARDRAGNYVLGYELAPPSGYLGSEYASNIGDLAALTQTPGSGVRYFPIGAI